MHLLCRLPVNDPWNMLRLLCPDVIVCGVSMVTVILCSRLVRDREMVAAANIIMVSQGADALLWRSSYKKVFNDTQIKIWVDSCLFLDCGGKPGGLEKPIQKSRRKSPKACYIGDC